MKEDVLPEGWVKTTLEYLGKWGSGGTPNRKYKEYYEGNISWVKTGDLGEKYLFKSSEYISKLGLKNSSAKMFPKGAIVLAMYGATIGKVSILDIEASTNQACAVIIPNENIDTEFLYYFLLSQKDIFIKKGKGGAQPNISQAIIKEHDINLPPLPEQQYLSKKLTALLDEVAQIKQRLEAIPALLKQFRQSVLADAVSGRLTEEWRENKEYELIDKLTFPKGWMKSTLGKEFNYGSCKKKSPDEILNQEWVLELEDIEKDNSNILNKITNATRQAKSTKNVFKKGDVLYGKLRPYLNKIVIADGDGVCTTEIIPISSNERICNQYLFYWLKSPYFFNYVNEITYGVNMPRLGTQDGKKAIIVFPSKEEQTQIVQKVETYFALADEIETQVNAALENVNLLTQSILAKAFNGELSAAWRTQQAVKN
ncbi:restriction endonuclease subunit S [Aggregatibacter segnis]|uniref:restriction endonuclease subunit S n=1 Tax=Aggregatibacter segnis TaxID=739 RepID=UPI0013A55AB2|nr:restriction endonuclease subunit S [Aggregatibacter segnis]